jgi:hypothetical protein
MAERYTLVITRWVDKTPEEIEFEVKNRDYNNMRSFDDDRFRNSLEKQKQETALTVSITTAQFEAIRKSVLENF